MSYGFIFSYFSINKFPLRNALFIDFNFNGRDKMMDRLNYTICIQLELIAGYKEMLKHAYILLMTGESKLKDSYAYQEAKEQFLKTIEELVDIHTLGSN